MAAMGGLRETLNRVSLAPCVVLLGACSPSTSDRQTIRFWAMGREGEVIAQLLPEFERRNPGIRVQVQQLPVDCRARETADRLCRRRAAGSVPAWEYLGTGIRGARCPRDLDPLVASSAIIVPEDYFPGIWDTNIVDGRLARNSLVCRYAGAVLPQRPARKAGFDKPPRSWDEWERALAAVKRVAGPSRYAILLPLNEFEPLLALGLQQQEPLLRDDGRWGGFLRVPAFVAHWTSTRRCFARVGAGYERRGNFQRLDRVRPGLLPSTFRGRGTSRNSSGACRRNIRRTG
jgi:multiple sugar transport system substrate-binding protein